MNKKEKHTENLRTNLLKTSGSLCLALFFFFIASTGFASEQTNPKVYTAEKGKVVYSVVGGENLTIAEGKITAAKGQSIRLLPGTHIKDGGQLAINIADKDCQDAVAREEAKQREETMLARVAEKQEKNLLPKSMPVIHRYCHAPALPDDKTRVGQQTLSPAAVAPAPVPTCKAPVSDLAYRMNNPNIHHSFVSTICAHRPARSWGDAAETVKVLRC
ncbi:MAG TPA: hypothetical protein PLK12_02130 [Prolixibacteraceae bacterium]|nr:hypothetical protein [Prolixibacteraceae bacterium]